MNEYVILIEPTAAPVIEVQEIQAPFIEIGVGIQGPAGEAGPQGIQGIQGPTGAGVGGFYVHLQAVPANEWDITHGLGFYPNVSVTDSSNRQVLTDIEYITINRLKVQVEAAFSGSAYLS